MPAPVSPHVQNPVDILVILGHTVVIVNRVLVVPDRQIEQVRMVVNDVGIDILLPASIPLGREFDCLVKKGRTNGRSDSGLGCQETPRHNPRIGTVKPVQVRIAGRRPVVNDFNAETGLGIPTNMEDLVVNVRVHVVERIVKGLVQKITVNPADVARTEAVFGNGVEQELELVKHDAMGDFRVVCFGRLPPLCQKRGVLVKEEVFEGLFNDVGNGAEAKEVPYGSENGGCGRLAEYDEGAGNQKSPHRLA